MGKIFRGSLNEQNFDGLDLRGAAFVNVSGIKASFKGADLRGATFRECTFEEADFREAVMDDVAVENSYFRRADFTEASLNRTAFLGSNLDGAKMVLIAAVNLALRDVLARRASLASAVLDKAILRDVDLSYSDLAFASMLYVGAEGINLAGARLPHANLSCASLVNANLRGVMANEAIFVSANLADADATGGHFMYANFTEATLSGANFSRTQLQGAQLSGTTLWQTNFSGAVLSGTSIGPEYRAALKRFLKECPIAGRRGGRIVYRTEFSQHSPEPHHYLPGRTYTAPVFSSDTSSRCHPGIYAGSLSWMRRLYPGLPIVKCYVRAGDWVLDPAKGAVRCARLRVLERVEP